MTTSKPAPADDLPVFHNTFAEALAAFQTNLPSVKKGQTANVKSDKGSYTYDYADLTDVSEVVLPALARVGLAWFTGLDTAEDGNMILTWELLHGASGEGRTGRLPIGRAGGAWQQIGSAITYARRYALTAATGVAPGGDDNDGRDAYAGDRPEPRQTPIQQVKEYLPEGLYDLASLTTREEAEAMFYKARAAKHLPLIIGLPDGTEMDFGGWLRTHGASLPPREQTVEEAEAAGVAAHEAEVAAQEAAAAGGPASPEDNS